ncbi:hypothetical protein TNCV_4674481 [Trichonephila clavipes]|nr:hypothetical protein TNCV_4674481 [Trichonephila clavipes]
MGDDVMDIHAYQSDESLMDDLSPRPSSSGSFCGEHVRRLDDLLYFLNCRGLRTRLADLKSIISTYQRHALLFRRHFCQYHDNASAWL